MKNDLNSLQRRKLKIGVMIALVVFLIGYTLFLLRGHINLPSQNSANLQAQVIFQQPVLKIFGYKEILNTYPDSILMNYPYLLVIRPEEGTTTIYNLQTQKKEKLVKDVLLDYYQGDFVSNKQKGTTYFNNKDLNKLCSLAFIRSKQEILCAINSTTNGQENKLVSINPETGESKNVYASQNLLTAIFATQDTIYLGTYDPIAQKSFILINDKSIPIPDWINLIYPMNNQIYLASFKSVRNKNTEAYYLINTNNVSLIEKERIILK